MCGIAGFCNWKGDWEKNIGRMCDRMRHRGPDGSGVWATEDHSVVLGHRRLAIVDLSPAGAQPMVSRDGRYVIAYNGEIYNHTAIRKKLQAEKKAAACRSEKEKLMAAVETLKNQLALAGEEKTLSLLEVGARKERWQQEKEELSLKRDGKNSALTANLELCRKVKERRKDIAAVEETYIWMKALSDTANGTLSGKRKIELETYIQMAWFESVLRRANLRLLTMSSGQYELKREEEGENRKEKAGLDICVIDHYNGSLRSVKTLSGGESFQASLALALGLSDEIQSYAGGIQMDSLFVDEGFGSLDEEALSQAMRALTRLTEGRRLVGIISHVAELKEKIDRKIIVTKKREKGGAGSSVKIEC